MSVIKGIQWSSIHDDQYVVYGPDISLFQVQQLSTGTPISDSTQSNLLANNTDVTFMKCLAWSPHSDHNDLFAVGHANGRVLLSSCSSNKSSLVGKEFAPRHPRHCNYLAWHSSETNLLVEGLELNPRYKSDACIYMWDVSMSTEIPMSPDKMRASFSESGAITKPYLEIGSAESSYSFSWLVDSPMCFLTGVAGKMLKIFDLREPSKPKASTHTKAVYGVCVDPCGSDHKMASFSESIIQVWDKRSFDRPMLTLSEQKSIVKIGWCPTRHESLACLTKDNPVIKVYDIRHHAIGTDDVEPFMFERNIIPYPQQRVLSFSWHPLHDNRLLAVTAEGSVRDITMCERVASAWSPSGHLLWSCGRKAIVLAIDDVLGPGPDEDISAVMRNRALKGYGNNMEQVWQNADLVSDNVSLNHFWFWMDFRALIDENIKLGRVSHITNIVGVKSLLKGLESNPGVAFSNDGSTFRAPIYQSEQRSQALQLAGWNPDPTILECRLLRMEKDGEYERAAAIALFNLKLRHALDILHRGTSRDNSDVSLTAVAMALSGYSQERRGLWRETCTNLRPKLKHPYLRAMFAFLLAEDADWEGVLNETDMVFRDRVGFACTYLNDRKLQLYIDSCMDEMISRGHLDGILLTGMSEEGVRLLQSYVDHTGDVQTAALAAVFTGSQSILQHARVQHWVDSYRKLLDRWALWHVRSEFDIHHHMDATSNRPQAQVFVSCNFCGKSISCVLPPTARKMPHFTYTMGSPSPNKARVSSCPGCRKPLPRCALCLRNMGTTSGTIHQHLQHTTDNHLLAKHEKMCEFDSWFTWCQTCRHGGHSSHVTQWFAEHSECPVSGCACRCMTLDCSTHERLAAPERRTSIKTEAT